MNTTVTQTKNAFNWSNGRLNISVQVRELEDVSTFPQCNTVRIKNRKATESISEQWNLFKWLNILAIRVSKGQEAADTQKFYQNTVAENFPNLMETIYHRSKTLKKSPSQETWRKLPWHIVIKSPKPRNRENLVYGGARKIIAGFSPETM